jgi:DNA-binding transcriptional ArsR family regulator
MSFLRARRGSVQVLDMAELCDLTGIPRRSLDRALTQLRDAGKVAVTRRTSRTGPIRLEVV